MLPVEELSRLLKPGLVDAGPYWSEIDDLTGDAQIWEDLAREDPLHAAAAAADEDAERAKTSDAVAILLAEAADGVILDIGCGYGRIAKYLLVERTFEGYIGLDGSPTMLRFFHERHPTSAPENATPLLLIHSPIDRIPLVDSSVQSVVISEVLLHNPKATSARVIGQARRVLRPGGKLFVLGRDFINAATLGGLQAAAFTAWLHLSGDEDRNGPMRAYRRSEVAELFKGFSRVRLRPNDFRLLPKTIAGSSGRAGSAYRRAVSTPVNAAANALVPRGIKRRMPDYWQVIATK